MAVRWIIGDIHGMLAPLQTLLEAVRSYDPSPDLIFVGDYVNRGPESRGVVDLLLTLTNAQFVRGNHDDIFDQIVNDQSLTGGRGTFDRVMSFQWFMSQGLDMTFLSYGVELQELEEVSSRPGPDSIAQLVSVVPHEHREFFRNLPALVEHDDLFVVHAKWDCNEPDALLGQKIIRDDKMRHSLLWGRYSSAEAFGEKAWSRTGYVGHTPVSTYWLEGQNEALPLTGPKLVLLDTAVALGRDGRLTAFCPDEHTFLQSDHFGHFVESET